MILIVSDKKENKLCLKGIEDSLIQGNINYKYFYFYSNRPISKLFPLWQIYFKRLIKKHNPKVIVFVQHYDVRNQLIREAKRLGVPTVELQHGRIYPNHKYYFQKQDKYKPDYIITYGDYEKKLFKANAKYKDVKILPLGCPRYDKLKKFEDNKKTEKTIFWAAQDDAWEYMKLVSSYMKGRKNWGLFVKWHPVDKGKKNLKYFNIYKSFNMTLIHSASTERYIAETEMTMIKNSTVGMESILMGHPVISLEDFSFKIIGKTRKDRKEYIKRHFNNFGTATQKVVRFLSEFS